MYILDLYRHFLCIALSIGTLTSGIPCNEKVFYSKDRCPSGYVLLRDQMDCVQNRLRPGPEIYYEADAICSTNETSILEIDSIEKHIAITKEFNLKSEVWIGAMKLAGDRQFKWISTGKALTWTRWARGRPRPSLEKDKSRCVVRKADGYWRDIDCYERRSYLCESFVGKAQGEPEMNMAQETVLRGKLDSAVTLNCTAYIEQSAELTFLMVSPKSSTMAFSRNDPAVMITEDGVFATNVQGECSRRFTATLQLPMSGMLDGARFSCCVKSHLDDLHCVKGPRAEAVFEPQPPNLRVDYLPRPRWLKREAEIVIAICTAHVGSGDNRAISWLISKENTEFGRREWYHLFSGDVSLPNFIREAQREVEFSDTGPWMKSTIKMMMTKKDNGFIIACFSYNIAKVKNVNFRTDRLAMYGYPIQIHDLGPQALVINASRQVGKSIPSWYALLLLACTFLFRFLYRRDGGL